MKVLGKYWKLLLALILICLAAHVYFNMYEAELEAYETEVKQLNTYITALQSSITENARYADVQDKLEEATAKVDASRLALYEHFPVEMKEEDQIMYVLYLETLFGTEIHFSFSQPVSLVMLNDGTDMQGLLMQVNYDTTYQGFKDMVSYLASDERIVSVYDATIQYDATKDRAMGTLSLILYLMYNEDFTYELPDIAIPELGKDNLFE